VHSVPVYEHESAHSAVVHMMKRGELVTVLSVVQRSSTWAQIILRKPGQTHGFVALYEGTGVRKQPVLEALREEDAKRVGGSALTVRQRDRSPNLDGKVSSQTTLLPPNGATQEQPRAKARGASVPSLARGVRAPEQPLRPHLGPKPVAKPRDHPPVRPLPGTPRGPHGQGPANPELKRASTPPPEGSSGPRGWRITATTAEASATGLPAVPGDGGHVSRFLREKKSEGLAGEIAARTAGLDAEIFQAWLDDAVLAVRARHTTAIHAYRAFADILVDGNTMGMSIDALVHGLRSVQVPIRESWVLQLWAKLGGEPDPGPRDLVFFKPFAAVFRQQTLTPAAEHEMGNRLAGRPRRPGT